MKIPFCKVSIGDEEVEAVSKVLRSGWLAAGTQTEAFEKEFSAYINPTYMCEYCGKKKVDWIVKREDKSFLMCQGCREKRNCNETYIHFEYSKLIDQYYCIFTNSGTSALKMAYKWFQDNFSGWLLFPRNTFCATYSAAEEMFSSKRYESHEEIDHDWGYYDEFKDYNNEPWHTLFRVNVHYGGIKDTTPCLIEDSAHRIEPNDPLVGKIRCYSFYATKNMTTGSGGMLTTNSKEIYEKCRLYWKDGLSTSTYDRQHGKGWNYEVNAMAGGYDGNDLAAAIGREQLKKLPQFTQKRNEVVKKYNKAIGQNWQGNHLYPYFVKSEKEVAKFIDYMKQNSISCGYHYPNTGWLGVSLPIFPDLTKKEQNYIIKKVLEYEKN